MRFKIPQPSPAPEGRLNFRAVQINGTTCLLAIKLVDCFEESLREQNQVASVPVEMAQAFELCLINEGKGFQRCRYGLEILDTQPSTKGTGLPVPHNHRRMRALAPEVRFWGYGATVFFAERKRCTSGAKALILRSVYGTGKPVPFVESCLSRISRP